MKKQLRRLLSLTMAVGLAGAVATSASAASVTLQPSGYTLEVGEHAPTQIANAYHRGGNTGLFTFDDFTDLAAYPEAKDAVNWWLSSGVTNGGKTFTTFGADDPFYRYDLAFFLYRYYSIVNDDGMWFYDDVPINQMGSTIGMKFNDAVTNVRWSGIMNGVGALSAEESATGQAGVNCFDPYGYVTTETLLTTLFRLINYQDGTTANPEFPTSETMQVNANFDYTLEALSAEEANQVLAGVTVSEWAKPYVGAMVKAGLYTPAEGDDLTGDMKKVDVIQVLYDICAGTGGRHQMTETLLQETDETKVFDKDTTLTGENWFIGGETEPASLNGVIVRDGAKVTLNNSEITYGKISAANPYPLAYRWGHCAHILAYGEDTYLTIQDSTLNYTDESSFAHQSVMGLEVEAGATAHLINCKTDNNTSGLLCYDGTLIYEDCTLLASDRVTSSDFFSGIVVYDNTTVNQGTDTVAGGFMDEAATTYVLGSDYFGAGTGNQTGISTFYGYDSTLVMSPTSCTNNTSMLSDVTSITLEDCDVTYTGAIANVVREGKLVLKYIDCGEIQLGELGEDEYDISITGTEFGSFAAVRLYVDGSTFNRPLKVYVANGCELEIIYTGEAPAVDQDTSATKTVQCYANTEILPEVETTNTGVVTLTVA